MSQASASETCGLGPPFRGINLHACSMSLARATSSAKVPGFATSGKETSAM
eukprot:CAMPEP_0170578028 /NCGR_PEP_ID=MMETSP0224-20130122/5242_1 /TAXON_ID=285029 /ORGANISM="Togula jolla, Strain CCCM 725" /LENGTH=50 /DNA_ID=CAMNT_0010900979 /DNA_START=736 /DNA_END=888 /DNA_ORIENTATION=+